jgi:hypothetical protein
MNARTAPPGYSSNFDALMALLRFGPEIWNCAQFKALAFHAERSIAYGRASDRHSESQAMNGVYSVQNLEWVRGPCGLSRASWYQANAELAIDPEDPSKTPDGVLRRHGTGGGRKQIVEYEIDWLAVKARITRWKIGENPTSIQGKKGSRIWTLSAQKKGPEFGPFPEKGSRIWTPVENSTVENKDSCAEKGSKIWTLHTLDTTDGLESPSVGSSEGRERVQNLDPFKTGPFSVSRDMLNLEIEIACGERPRTDGPTDLILKANEKLRLAAEVIVRFLHWKAGDFRGRNYRFNPQLLAKSFTTEIFAWCNNNREFVDECQRRVELEQRRKAEVTQMPKKRSAEQIEREIELLDQLIDAWDTNAPEPAPPPDPVKALLGAESGRLGHKPPATATPADAQYRAQAPPGKPPGPMTEAEIRETEEMLRIVNTGTDEEYAKLKQTDRWKRLYAS